MTKKRFIPLEELLEKGMRESDSIMKETIQDYLFLRKKAEGQSSLDTLRIMLVADAGWRLHPKYQTRKS